MAKQFDALNFLLERGYRPASEGDRHFTPGWLNVPCPFCTGNPGNHLGWNSESTSWHCFRCGSHSWEEVVGVLASTSDEKETQEVIRAYSRRVVRTPRDGGARHPTPPSEIHLPLGTDSVGPQHLQYLQRRGYEEPSLLVDMWGLKGTGPLGPFKHRIIAPIYHKGKLVSYQGRDITNKQTLRYKNCSKTEEGRSLKSCLYGLDKLPQKESVVVVEGITDVWRLGPGSVATFGLKVTSTQISLLCEFRKVTLLFDPGHTESEQAYRLGRILSQKTETSIAELEGAKDPASLTQMEADELMKTLF